MNRMIVLIPLVLGTCVAGAFACGETRWHRAVCGEASDDVMCGACRALIWDEARPASVSPQDGGQAAKL